MKVEIGKSYEICNLYISLAFKSCFIIEVKNQEDIRRVKVYLKSPRTEVKEYIKK